MKRLFVIVGTRPNFVKVAQFKQVAASFPKLNVCIVHTGQHSDATMSDVFFDQLNCRPDFFLNETTSDSGVQIGNIISKLSALFVEQSPDLILAVGDVNSTLATAIAANKTKVKLAHLESGLRSFDQHQPEEINRRVTDFLSDYCFVTEEKGKENLINEGKELNTIYVVGNTMLDTLRNQESRIRSNNFLARFGVEARKYFLVTIHRPRNVDSKQGLTTLVDILHRISSLQKIVFPLHPRTRNNLKKHDMMDVLKNVPNVKITQPLDYFSFQNALLNSSFVITDSGGLQNETSFYDVPCATLNPSSEHHLSCEYGTNSAVNYDASEVFGYISSYQKKENRFLEYFKENATENVLRVLNELI